MSIRAILWTALSLLAIALSALTIWLYTLPMPLTTTVAVSVPQAEVQAMLASLAPRSPKRPVIAVVGLNQATETTDYLLTAGVLRRADVADVVLLATNRGPVQLYPALKVEANQSLSEFDALHPEGADYVIVPAMSRDDDPDVLAWLRAQSDKGAHIIGVCAGAKVVAAAGLLDGKPATTHWYYRDEMLKGHPTISYVANRRMVVNEDVSTTTGISASIPMMLTLIQAISGQPKAEEVARDLGISSWNAGHLSEAFKFTRPFATTVLANSLAFWRAEEISIELQSGMDEVTLALVADSWSRTYRSKAVTFSATGAPVTSKHGMTFLPDKTEPDQHDDFLAPLDRQPVHALDQTLDTIAFRYGRQTAGVVAMQLEYPGFDALSPPRKTTTSTRYRQKPPYPATFQETSMPSTIHLHRVFTAPPEKLYRAFIEADAIASWSPPFGFLCTVHELDAKVGGHHRMSFRNFTTGNSHVFGGTYLELVPGERIVYTDKFEDPTLPDEMQITVNLQAVSVGTELTIEQQGVPDAIPAEACYLGWQESLFKLAKLVEPEIHD